MKLVIYEGCPCHIELVSLAPSAQGCGGGGEVVALIHILPGERGVRCDGAILSGRGS